MPWKWTTPLLMTFLSWLLLHKHVLSMRNDSQTFNFFSELTWELETTLTAWLNSTVNLSHWPDTPTHLPLFFMSHCSFDFLSYYGRYHYSLYICISVLLSAHTAVNMETCDQIWLIKSEQESPVSHSNGGSLCSIFIIFVSWHGNFRCHFPDDLAPRWMCAHIHNIPRCEGK